MSTLAIKFTSLAIRTLAKPIANQIKSQAKDHERFRKVCISIAQTIHRTDMHIRLGLLRDSAAIERAEMAEEKHKKEEAKRKEEEKEKEKEKQLPRPGSVKEALNAASAKLEHLQPATNNTPPNTPASSSSSSSSATVSANATSTSSAGGTTPSSKPDERTASSSSKSESSSESSASASQAASEKVKKKPLPKIRPLSDAKAIERGANFISETFLFAVAGGLILFETIRSRRKEGVRRDLVAERLQTLEEVDEIWRQKVEMLERRLDQAGIRRLPETPTVQPTTGEGSPEQSGSGAWFGWFGRKAIPEPIKTVEERTATTPLQIYIKETKEKQEASTSSSPLK